MKIFFDHVLFQQANHDFNHTLVSAIFEENEYDYALDNGWFPIIFWIDQNTEHSKRCEKPNEFAWEPIRLSRIVVKDFVLNKKYRRLLKNNITTEFFSSSKVDFEELFFKDSLDMDNEDRLMIAQRIKKEPIKNIVVIHGTDTMVQTAQTIKEHASQDKVVVITGAMLPFSLKESDAMFNFGGAFVATQTLEPGIWISMNGHIFRSDDVEKNKRKGVFEKA